jgi:hypothetical protein
MTDQPWPDIGAPLWYRTLYWRIGIGFVVFLALILTVQVVFLARNRPFARYPARPFAVEVRGDGGRRCRIRAHPKSTDESEERYVQHRYAQVSHPFFVLLTDGRLLTNGVLPAPGLQQFMRNELRRRIRNVSPLQPFRPARRTGVDRR